MFKLSQYLSLIIGILGFTEMATKARTPARASQQRQNRASGSTTYKTSEIEGWTVYVKRDFLKLMKRAVYDQIGGLDERFGIGLFDDDDLAERARRAGFELAVARGGIESLGGGRLRDGSGSLGNADRMRDGSRDGEGSLGNADGTNQRESPAAYVVRYACDPSPDG